MSKGKQIVDRIHQVLADGKILYIQTPLKTIVVKQKDVDKFHKAGRPLFKATENSAYISVGKRYDCINFCQFTLI